MTVLYEDERTVLYKTKLLDGTKPNANPKTNPGYLLAKGTPA